MHIKKQLKTANDNPDPDAMTVLEAMEQLCEMVHGARQALLEGFVDRSLEPTAKKNIKAMEKAIGMMCRHLQDVGGFIK